MTRCVNTLDLAKRRFPGAQVSLDALCKRFGIDCTARTLHGALLDSQLLAEVYLELLGGRQQGLGLAVTAGRSAAVAERLGRAAAAPRPLRAAADRRRARGARGLHRRAGRRRALARRGLETAAGEVPAAAAM